MSSELLLLAKRVQAIAEGGEHYCENDWDRERYNELEDIAMKMMSLITNQDLQTIKAHTYERNGYKTPKTDVRAVIFNPQGEILMVKEVVDGRWSLPGGWADVGYTPSEVAVKETREEAGLVVKPGRLLAVLDKKCHKHPEDLFYIYKIFIECKAEDFNPASGMETTDVGFFSLDKLPELSTPRNTRGQIESMFDICLNDATWPLLD